MHCNRKKILYKGDKNMKKFIKAVKMYFRFKRLVRNFKRTHEQMYTIHQNSKGEEWITIKWVPNGIEA